MVKLRVTMVSMLRANLRRAINLLVYLQNCTAVSGFAALLSIYLSHLPQHNGVSAASLLSYRWQFQD